MKKKSSMTDLARKLLMTGVGAIFMTQEGIRKTLSEMELPKDAVSNLTDSLRRQKDEVLNLIAGELRNFLSKLNVHEEMQKALTGMQVKLEATMSFDKKGSPKTKVRVRKKAR